MIQAIVPGALTFALLTASQVSVPVTPSAQFQTTSTPSVQKLIWVVKHDDTLLSIAKQYYGDEKYWTTLWNDNQFIADPNVIDAGQILTLRLKAPANQEQIRQSLKDTYPTVSYTTDNPLTQAPELPVSVTPIPVETVVSPTPSPAPATTSYSGGPLSDAQITFLGNCEAGMNPARNSGNGYYGAFQFSYGTWKSMGTAYERADLAPIEVQKDAVQRLLSRSSIFTQFPGCARKMQAEGLL
jgi:hypothetical protein